MEIKKISVIGAGTMGNGIAHVFAQNGFSVNLVDIKKEYVEKAVQTISKNLDRQVKKEIIDDEQKNFALDNITGVVGVENTPPDTNLVIEAVSENYQIKRKVWETLQSVINAEAIFASNTSSISITELASGTRPEKFIGMHFMNPVPVMKLVEIIRGYSTSLKTFETIKSLTEIINKVPVQVHDYPGFISNRVLMPMINEAIFCLYEGVASIKDIDTVMKLGMNHPMGPLTLADFIGLDVCLSIMNVLYEGFNDSKYRACPLLKKMVAAGKLGRKSGEGFYKY
ncbi:MAG: 3-hydroxybutyryl-CoA dehydrogenase [Melioribacteraceae bacterium]|nr:3-hydroxybutyryl-CoA dehydrogenase [Melioribacteraceae bacterium]MCF8265429.1 3-hydroxybutyryl-CoA dehydrogenase [Melioribacteraceae bacterium]MCF8432119.1 3-hydroxybutyryl-CoA dehydrogenase [Melioribacteraceae bacterium]